jgi:hypothetical protein
VILPLQAADFLAWQKHRYHNEPLDAELQPAYRILRDANIPRIESVWFDHKIEQLIEDYTRNESDDLA